MPNVGSIYGIIFFIIREVGQPHHSPHFKAVYGKFKANYEIGTGKKLVRP